MKKLLLISAFCFLLSALQSRAAGLLTPFEAYTTDIIGQIKTNPVTIEAWTFTNTITGVSTNLVLNFSATYYPAASNGYFAGELAPGNYRMTVDGLSRGVLFGIPSSTNTQTLAQLATGVPIYAFMNWTLAQFTDVGTAAYSNTSAFFLSALAGTAAFSNAAAFTTPTQATNHFLGRIAGHSNAFNGSFTGDAQSVTNLQAGAFTSGTSAIPATATLLGNHVNVSENQTIPGAKTFTGTLLVSNETGIFHIGTLFSTNLNGIVGAFTNGQWWGPAITNANFINGNFGAVTGGVWRSGIAISLDQTNGRNFGNAFRSPGSGVDSEQFGTGAEATGDAAMALGYNANASGDNALAIGKDVSSGGTGSIAMGNAASALAIGSTAIGTSASVDVDSPYGLAIGPSAAVSANHPNSMAIGYSAVTTASNQIMLGTSAISVRINNNGTVGGNFAVSGYTTNINAIGTNSFSDIALRRLGIGTLANGINDDIIVGTNSYVQVSGPTGAFSIRGWNGSPNRNGHVLFVEYNGAQNCTIAVEGGATGNGPVEANRIVDSTGADRTSTGAFFAIFIYNASTSRWRLAHFDP